MTKVPDFSNRSFPTVFFAHHRYTLNEVDYISFSYSFITYFIFTHESSFLRTFEKRKAAVPMPKAASSEKLLKMASISWEITCRGMSKPFSITERILRIDMVSFCFNMLFEFLFFYLFPYTQSERKENLFISFATPTWTWFGDGGLGGY